jgi:hypothetical protein
MQLLRFAILCVLSKVDYIWLTSNIWGDETMEGKCHFETEYPGDPHVHCALTSYDLPQTAPDRTACIKMCNKENCPIWQTACNINYVKEKLKQKFGS